MSELSYTVMGCRHTSVLVLLSMLWAASVAAQTDGERAQDEPQTRAAVLRLARQEKSEQLQPYVIPSAEERVQFLKTWRLPRLYHTKSTSTIAFRVSSFLLNPLGRP
jgi:hypothetical protein